MFGVPLTLCAQNLPFIPLPISVILEFIINTVVSDHAMVLLDLLVEGAPKRTKHWRFNTLLLKDNKFISYFNSEFKIFLVDQFRVYR